LQFHHFIKCFFNFLTKLKSNNDNFFERVYEIVRQIPEGKVTSYGAIAKALGAARSARMVGWAMNASHNLEDVPAHRVVSRRKRGRGRVSADASCYSPRQENSGHRAQ